MGFTLRFMIGLFLVLAICSNSKSTSIWRRVKRLSQEVHTTTEPSSISTPNNLRDGEEQKRKTDINSTDEVNKIVSEINNKEEEIGPPLVEEHIHRPLSVPEDNDLSKESLEYGRAAHEKSIDLNINIEKYLSPDFHDKNNVHKLSTSPDIAKYVNLGNESYMKSTATLETTTNYDIDKKIQTIKNDINKKLGYIDQKIRKSTIQYEDNNNNVTPTNLNLLKYKNTTFIGPNGNTVHKDEEVETGQNIDYGSSYNHSLFDDQNSILQQESTSDAHLDSKTKINGTDDLKNKFRAKTTIDPEVLSEKLNQTERRTALLSNKIEFDNASENRRLKWSFHYASSTMPYTTANGEKEEIMFVPYDKENPINISKRGSTKFVDTITTSEKPSEIKAIPRFKENRTLDGATVENQIYPVHVPAPKSDLKEETTDRASQSPLLTVTEDPNVSFGALPITNSPNTKRNVTERQPITSNIVELDTTTSRAVSTLDTTTVFSERTNIENATLFLSNKSNEDTTIFSAPFTMVNAVEENSTLNSLYTPGDVETTLSSTTSVAVTTTEENLILNSTAYPPIYEQNTTLKSVVTPGTAEEIILSNFSIIPMIKEENSTTSTLWTVLESDGNSTSSSITSTTEEVPASNYVSDQTIAPTTLHNASYETTTAQDLSSTSKEDPYTTETIFSSSEDPESTTYDVVKTTVVDTTSRPTAVETASLPTMPSLTTPDYKSSTKLNEGANNTPTKFDDRTSGARDLKNFTTVTLVSSTTMLDKESQTETTIDYRDNVIKQEETITSTTEPIEKSIPTETVITRTLPGRKQYSGSSNPELSTPEETTGEIAPQEPEESNGGKIAAIVISCIGALCFVILAILLYVMRKRHKRFNYGQRCTPVSLDAYSVDNVSAYNSVRRKGMMRASKRSYGNPAFDESSVGHLLNFPELMKFSNYTEEIGSEYDNIPQISVQTNELPEGCEIKNRYANVIPLPESRVFLSMSDECPNSDYINANFVTGPKSTKSYYIACQAPMQNTVDDFWRMIWEQQTRVVLMLTHLFENGSEKCFDYLPPSEVLDCHRLFGDFQITLKKREVKEKYVISSLQLKNMVSNTWREVTHFWYLGWPERGVPVEESSLVACLIEARSYIKAAPSENGKLRDSIAQGSNGTSHPEHNPVVVHCSPGTGRTGTVIACDIAIREFELCRQVDIPKIVYQIRRSRAGAVQTKEQYAFIYRVITWYANKLTGGVLDSL